MTWPIPQREVGPHPVLESQPVIFHL